MRNRKKILEEIHSNIACLSNNDLEVISSYIHSLAKEAREIMHNEIDKFGALACSCNLCAIKMRMSNDFAASSDTAVR